MLLPAESGRPRGRWAMPLLVVPLLLLGLARPPAAAAADTAETTALLQQGERALRERDLVGAMRAFRTVLGKDPASWRALDGLGRTFRAIGDLQSAERELRRAVEAAPGESQPAQNLIDLIGTLPDAERRREGLRWLGEHATTSSELQLQVARAARRAGDLETASAALARAREIVPESKEVMLEEIFLYRDALDYPKAIEAANGFLRLDPNFHLVHAQLGRIAQLQGRPEEAAAHYERALELAPGDPSSLTRLGEIRMGEGNLEAARALLEQATQVAPERYQAHYFLGRLYLLLGDGEASARAMETFRRLKDAQRASARLAGGASMVDE